MRKLGARVRLVVYKPGIADKAAKEQLDFDLEKRSERWTRYFSHYRKDEPGSKEEFFAMLEAENTDFIADVKRHKVEVSYLVEKMPVFLWRSDQRRAVLSFYNLKGEAREVSFVTQDTKLIEVLDLIYRQSRE